jgi:alcohol dehydrogenase, propanol-preferring
MKAAVLHAFRTSLHLEQRPDPQPQGEQIPVRVRGVGVCHTDLHIIDGAYPHLPLPLVLGHEIAGSVEGIGDVLVYASWGDGTCTFCRRGEEQLCPAATEAGWLRDGGYAEWVVVPSRHYLLPLDGLDPIRAAPLADAGVAAYRAVQRIHPWLRRGVSVVVIGAGGLGQFAIQYLKLLTNATVIVLEPNESKHERARQIGADEVMVDVPAHLSARAVLDFVGSDGTLRQAAGIVEPTGIAVQVGEAGGHLSFGLGSVPHEASFTTSIWGSLDDLAAVLKHARQGELDWHVETLPLEQVNEALERLRQGDVLGRLVLTP